MADMKGKRVPLFSCTITKNILFMNNFYLPQAFISTFWKNGYLEFKKQKHMINFDSHKLLHLFQLLFRWEMSVIWTNRSTVIYFEGFDDDKSRDIEFKGQVMWMILYTYQSYGIGLLVWKYLWRAAKNLAVAENAETNPTIARVSIYIISVFGRQHKSE